MNAFSFSPSAQLALWQLTSPAFPVGAYNYSEGLEWWIDAGSITGVEDLQKWLTTELAQGSIRVETAIMIRAYRAAQGKNDQALRDWNQWVTATRETQELRDQSWQMGEALRKLLGVLIPGEEDRFNFLDPGQRCHYPIAFGVGAQAWGIDLGPSTLAYLQSWTHNLISAAVRLIPLGQTAGQTLLTALMPVLLTEGEACLTLEDGELYSCGWGLSLGSMNHECQYTRLFRS